MFWSLNTENKYVRSCIIKAAMDGSNEHVFIHRNLRYAASLTVDEQSERIYWLDTELRKIESVQFDGNNREVGNYFKSMLRNSNLITYDDHFHVR